MTTTVDEQQRHTIEQWYGPLGPHEVTLTNNVTVTIDDGTELTGTLILPAEIEKMPAVLIRSPYAASSFPPEVAALYMGEVITWASHGYAVYLQSTRSSTSYFHEATDGAATVAWIEQQPWFDGRLGLTGSSYHAFTAWATASTRPACLKAMATSVYSTDRVSSWYPGGGFALELALSWTALQQAGGADVGEQPYDHLPLAEADVVATGTTLDFYQERLAHPGDDPHWQPLDFSDLLDDPSVPILHIDGWYDYHRTYFWQDFERLRHNGSSMPYRIVIGPWPHAALDPRITMAENLAWFDTHLRGDGNDTVSAVRYYRTGVDGHWSELDAWQQEPTTQTFHAHSGGRLLTDERAEAQRVEWTYDPADPTPSVGFLTINHGDVSTPWDSSVLEQRPDVHAFTSEPLREPLDLFGRAWGEARFFSDAPSADLHLRILDIHEDGRAQNVADGILRLTDPALSDGLPVEIDLGPLGHRFGAGHRIRLMVSSGAHPYYNRNLGNGEPIATATRLRTAHQAIALGGHDGLRITLPLAQSARP